MRLKVVICDDDSEMVDLLVKFCQDLEEIEVVGAFNSGKELLHAVEEGFVDVLLLDIELPGQELNGLEIARRLQASNQLLKIVFITGHDNYYPEAFETYAYDYINKLSLTQRLPKTIKQIQKELMMTYKQERKICISVEGIDYFLFPNTIVYIKSEGRKLKIITEEGSFLIYGALKEWQKNLNRDFYVCHRSYIINLQKVEMYNRKKNKLMMSNGHLIPISIRKLSKIKTLLNRYIINN